MRLWLEDDDLPSQPPLVAPSGKGTRLDGLTFDVIRDVGSHPAWLQRGYAASMSDSQLGLLLPKGRRRAADLLPTLSTLVSVKRAPGISLEREADFPDVPPERGLWVDDRRTAFETGRAEMSTLAIRSDEIPLDLLGRVPAATLDRLSARGLPKQFFVGGTRVESPENGRPRDTLVANAHEHVRTLLDTNSCAVVPIVVGIQGREKVRLLLVRDERAWWSRDDVRTWIERLKRPTDPLSIPDLECRSGTITFQQNGLLEHARRVLTSAALPKDPPTSAAMGVSQRDVASHTRAIWLYCAAAGRPPPWEGPKSGLRRLCAVGFQDLPSRSKNDPTAAGLIDLLNGEDASGTSGGIQAEEGSNDVAKLVTEAVTYLLATV